MKKILFFLIVNFLFILNTNAMEITGRSGRVYSNIPNEKVIIYNTNGNTNYQDFRYASMPDNIDRLYTYASKIWFYGSNNFTESAFSNPNSISGTNYSFSRYSTNSSFSSWTFVNQANYIGINYAFDYYNNILRFIDYSYYDIYVFTRDANNKYISSIVYCGDGESSCLPAYLDDHICTTLDSGEVNLAISGVSSGTVYMKYDEFFNYGSRISYYDLDLDYQPWTFTIENYYPTLDGDFIAQDFDLSSQEGADLIMYNKYFYLEGEDNISALICYPYDAYTDIATVDTSQNGKVVIDFDYKDNNGNIQQQTINNNYSNNPFFNEIFNDFANNTFGLTSIITSPLSLINSLSSSTCQELNIPLPYLENKYITLPCMYSIYQNTFGSLFEIYQTITFGIISYWVLVRSFNLVKDFKNPDHDEIEVVDL